jgi:hypothetical protein
MSSTEIWLYGSTARGDREPTSDVDVLVVGDGDVDFAELPLPTRDGISVSRYQWNEIESMVGYGSLFLRHIRDEGKPLKETERKRLRSLLSSLGPYTRANQELACFSAVLDDVEQAMDGDHSAPFELSVVATAARHAAILGCYFVGSPTFGRSSAFQVLLPQIGYSDKFIDEIIDLYSFRRADDEGRIATSEKATYEDVMLWVTRVRRIIDQVGALGT